MTLRKLNRACLIACITSIAIITMLSLSLIWEPEKEHAETFWKVLSTAWLILFSAGATLSICKIYTGRSKTTSLDEPVSEVPEIDADAPKVTDTPHIDEPPYAPESLLPTPPPPDSE